MVGHGLVGIGAARQVWQVSGGYVWAGSGRAGEAWLGIVRLRRARQAGRGTAQRGLVWRSRQGATWLDMNWLGMAGEAIRGASGCG